MEGGSSDKVEESNAIAGFLFSTWTPVGFLRVAKRLAGQKNRN